ncbi:MAG: cyanophycin synthetase [Bacteroidota bacterium]
MAFQYFADEKVDIAVIEVGLGGRLDSTNVITPELSLITNISFDHQNLLGNTLEEIAGEKAGIIKSNVPVVISQRQDTVEDVFINKAGQMESEISFASDSLSLRKEGDGFIAVRNNEKWLTLSPQLKGNYQEKNIPGVLASVLELRKKGFEIPDTAIQKGISEVVTLTGLKGRWQKLSDRPLTICDTGHNPDGIRQVVEQIRSTPHKHLHFVFGAVKEKDFSAVFKLLPKDATYYFCQAKIPRALEADLLAEEATSFGLAGKIVPDVNDAYKEAFRNAGKDDMIFIGGSTFVVAEIDGL